jgi:uncharacterized protein
MWYTPLVISLPIADRRAASAFYRDVLRLDPIGVPAEDGIPEPLQFALSEGARLMLIPKGGFGWVIGGREVARPVQSECILSLDSHTRPGVDDLVERARRAGATVVSAPANQPWGYAGSFTDLDGHLWMVTCTSAS